MRSFNSLNLAGSTRFVGSSRLVGSALSPASVEANYEKGERFGSMEQLGLGINTVLGLVPPKRCKKIAQNPVTQLLPQIGLWIKPTEKSNLLEHGEQGETRKNINHVEKPEQAHKQTPNLPALRQDYQKKKYISCFLISKIVLTPGVLDLITLLI